MVPETLLTTILPITGHIPEEPVNRNPNVMKFFMSHPSGIRCVTWFFFVFHFHTVKTRDIYPIISVFEPFPHFFYKKRISDVFVPVLIVLKWIPTFSKKRNMLHIVFRTGGSGKIKNFVTPGILFAGSSCNCLNKKSFIPGSLIY